MKKIYIIIGASAAGIGAVQTARRLDKESEILCISDEAEMPYNKCFLADYLADRKALDAIYTKNDDFFKKNNIKLLRKTKVVSIDPSQKSLQLHNNKIIKYDALFLGLGKKMLPLLPEQASVKGIFTFHNLASLLLLEEYLKVKPVHSVLIIGAGLTGIECADALQKYNVAITIVDRNKHILSSQCDYDSSQFLQNFIDQQRIRLILGSTVKEIIRNNEDLQGVVLENGQKIFVDMIVIAVGAGVNTQLAQEAGILLDKNTKAIITNEHQQTNIESIYAGGDASMVFDVLKKKYVLNSLWADAMLQGSIAAYNMTEQKKSYTGTIVLAQSAFFGLSFASCGPIAQPPQEYEIITNKTDDFYHRYLLYENRLRGFLLLGTFNTLPVLRRLVLTQEHITREALINISS